MILPLKIPLKSSIGNILLMLNGDVIDVNIGWGNGFMMPGTKPLLDPILT